MAYKQPSSGSTFKMMGSSPAKKNGTTIQKDGKLIGPTKPMKDKDGDGIPVGIDVKDTPGGKQSTPPKSDSRLEYNTPKKVKPVSPKKTDPRKRPYDDGRNKGTLKGNTKFKSDLNKFVTPQTTQEVKTTVKNKAIKAYDYFFKK